VCGFKAVRFSARLKALNLNILRAAAVMAAMVGISTETDPKGGYRAVFNDVKERFWAARCFFERSPDCSPIVLRICSKPCFIEGDFLNSHQMKAFSKTVC
jgi:hypothetical protein